MEKYRVTEKHPDLKEGIQIFNNDNTYYVGLEDTNFIVSDQMINNWLKNGYIKEIQQPLFTEDDMRKAFWSGHNTSLTFDEYINE